ncbi:MAG TPA: hypothetical protein PLD10_17375 [Rhodopila sp.]|nr:hypothetical protein [Rhodopila sp.]
MAARTLRPRHSDEIRAKIQASQLVNRLTDHVLKGTDMSQTQVAAAKILLAKAVPDLKALEMNGPNGGPIQVTAIERTIIDPVK